MVVVHLVSDRAHHLAHEYLPPTKVDQLGEWTTFTYSSRYRAPALQDITHFFVVEGREVRRSAYKVYQPMRANALTAILRRFAEACVIPEPKPYVPSYRLIGHEATAHLSSAAE